jgi:hypothetical protein
MALFPMSGVLRGFSVAAYLSTALTKKPCAALLIEKIAHLQRETIMGYKIKKLSD